MRPSDIRAVSVGLLGGHARDPSRYHEVLEPDGTVRPHWRALIDTLDRLGPAQLRQRHEALARHLRDDGITHNLYVDAQATERPRMLDLLPQIVPSGEWQMLCAGVMQRAALLDAMLADLYGEQRLLRDGLLPAELVFGDDHFLWPCVGVRPPGGRFLHLYAVDLVRTPDGCWQVTADRTQMPSGAGHVLENRQLLARVMPELGEHGVQVLDAFYETLLATLRSSAPAGDGETPLVVLLTPGREGDGYVEHVVLARHLGVALVEGQDLTVRGDTLFLKTLGGLCRVHAVLRCLDDDFCDPLELRGDSALGVAGLVGVVRAGRVLIANALGSGVLEAPGLFGFLPAICDRLLGDSLLLPSVPATWHGGVRMHDAISVPADRRVSNETTSSSAHPSTFEPAIDAAMLAALHARARGHPSDAATRTCVRPSEAPVWQLHGNRARLVSRAIGLRMYAVATEAGYQVLPGGLTRVLPDEDGDIASMRREYASKDTWIAAGTPHAREPRPPVLRAADIVRHNSVLPSRLVENLFWLGRYAERLDGSARLLRIVLAQHETAGADRPAFDAAVDACRTVGLLHGTNAIGERLRDAIADVRLPASIADTLTRLTWAATQVRTRLSQEHWRTLTQLQQTRAALSPERLEPGNAATLLDNLLLACAALAGYAHEDMTRDDGWRFLMIARRLERLQFFGDVMARTLRHRGGTETATLDWLLALADSSITYRSRYHAAPQLIPALDLMVCDPCNPHALVFQVSALHADLAALPMLGHELADTVRAVAELEDRLRGCNLSALEDALFGGRGRADALLGVAQLAATAADVSRALSDRLTLRCFAHIRDIGHSTVAT